MQEYAVKMRDDLWLNLKKVFDSVSQGRQEITVPQIESVVKNVMGETQKTELDYIFNNMFRIDTDNSGAVNFNEFANFFLKRHCGEIALQRAHRKSLIGKGAERKLNLTQFLALLNDAYSFLNVETDDINATEIFRLFDTDRDNHITYVEYFQFIEKYICKSKAVLKAEAERRPLPIQPVKVTTVVIPSGKVYKSRLRYFIWECLRKLYNAFDFNKDGKLQIQEIKTLIADILKLKNRKDIDYVLFSIFNFGSGNDIEFGDFCPYFVEHVGNLGLSQLVSLHPNIRRHLTKDQFVQLFKNSFVFLSTSRIQDQLLWRFFDKIDVQRRGYITFEQYITWLKDFLCPHNYRGDSYYFDLDDMDLQIGLQMILEQFKSVIVKQSRIIRQPIQISKYHFSNTELSKYIRSNLLLLLVQFDRNRNKLFQQVQIIDILQTLINENENQIPYVIRNVFRYDKDNDRCITFTEMSNFLLQMHCGEMAIQRLHKKQIYKLGAQRMMNADQFVITLNDALRYLRAQAPQSDLRILFTQIDLDRDQLITYKQYFQFLKYYFGSASFAALQELVVKTQPLSIEQQFGRWLQIQSSKALKAYIQPKMRMDTNSLSIILKRVFKQFDPEIQFVISNLFKIIFDIYNYSSDDEIRRLILLLHIGIVLLLRGHKAGKFLRYKQLLLSQQEFVRLILEATEWAELPADSRVLIQIFLKLDTDRDGFITYFQYLEFLRNCIGCAPNYQLDSFFNNAFALKPLPPPIISKVQPLPLPTPVTEKQQADDFELRVWNQLRQLFNHYLKNGATTLGRDDIKLLIGDVLLELNQQELDYVFWNYFRLDKDGNNQVSFQQFAPFILNHATEMALQRFHSKSTKGKSSLTIQQFILLANSAFGFLRSIPKQEHILRIIYRLLDTDKSGDLGYNEYLMWAEGLVKKYK